MNIVPRKKIAETTLVAIGTLTLISCSDDNNLSVGPEIDPAAITGIVWHDVNADGIRDSAETAGVSGIAVALQECALRQIDATATNDEGRYQFTSLPESDYNIRVDKATYLISPRHQGTNDNRNSDVDSTGSTFCFTLRATEIREAVDIGLFKTGTVRGAVWLDANADGIRDPGEAGVANQQIHLRDGSASFLESKNTDANGEYAFPNLTPANYLIEVPIMGFTFSPQGVGFDDRVDSDVDPATGTSAPAALESEATVFLDAGVHN